MPKLIVKLSPQVARWCDERHRAGHSFTRQPVEVEVDKDGAEEIKADPYLVSQAAGDKGKAKSKS